MAIHTRSEQARQIDAEISQWIGASNIDRASKVLDWCERNGVEVALVVVTIVNVTR